MFGEVRYWPLADYTKSPRGRRRPLVPMRLHIADILLCVGNPLGPMLAFEPDDHSDLLALI